MPELATWSLILCVLCIVSLFHHWARHIFLCLAESLKICIFKALRANRVIIYDIRWSYGFVKSSSSLKRGANSKPSKITLPRGAEPKSCHLCTQLKNGCKWLVIKKFKIFGWKNRHFNEMCLCRFSYLGNPLPPPILRWNVTKVSEFYLCRQICRLFVVSCILSSK